MISDHSSSDILRIMLSLVMPALLTNTDIVLLSLSNLLQKFSIESFEFRSSRWPSIPLLFSVSTPESLVAVPRTL